MKNANRQSIDLVHFISNIAISPEGDVSINVLEDKAIPRFQSDYYMPSFKASALARITQKGVVGGSVEELNLQLPKRTFTSAVIGSDLKIKHIDIYTLCQVVSLESFALVYHIREDTKGLRYMTIKDMRRTRENIKYLADFFGSTKEYYNLIEYARDMDIAVGYIEHQIEAIQSTRQVR